MALVKYAVSHASGMPSASMSAGAGTTIWIVAGTLSVKADLDARDPVRPDLSANAHGIGRELFDETA